MHFDPKLIEAMRNAKKVMAFTGAGASKESGLPTFRDLDDGVWRKYDPMTFATIEGFLANPVLVWNNYRSRQIQISQCQPNPGHQTLAAMEDYYPDFVVVTQNVDDLHERGGSKDVVHIHGDAFSIRCLDCSRCYSTRTLDLPVEFTEQTLPKCEACGATCRPDIVWFGEFVQEDRIGRAYDYANTGDLVLVVGTSGEVSRGYGLAQTAARRGAVVVEINPNPGALTQYATYVVSQPAGQALRALWQAATIDS